jgi:hypothetical protein
MTGKIERLGKFTGAKRIKGAIGMTRIAVFRNLGKMWKLFELRCFLLDRRRCEFENASTFQTRSPLPFLSLPPRQRISGCGKSQGKRK